MGVSTGVPSAGSGVNLMLELSVWTGAPGCSNGVGVKVIPGCSDIGKVASGFVGSFIGVNLIPSDCGVDCSGVLDSFIL